MDTRIVLLTSSKLDQTWTQQYEEEMLWEGNKRREYRLSAENREFPQNHFKSNINDIFKNYVWVSPLLCFVISLFSNSNIYKMQSWYDLTKPSTLSKFTFAFYTGCMYFKVTFYGQQNFMLDTYA